MMLNILACVAAPLIATIEQLSSRVPPTRYDITDKANDGEVVAEFVWSEGGRDVFLAGKKEGPFCVMSASGNTLPSTSYDAGSFNGWEFKIPMTTCDWNKYAPFRRFTRRVAVRPGRIQYKFIVDGVWRAAQDQDLTRSSVSEPYNNVICVTPPPAREPLGQPAPLPPQPVVAGGDSDGQLVVLPPPPGACVALLPCGHTLCAECSEKLRSLGDICPSDRARFGILLNV